MLKTARTSFDGYFELKDVPSGSTYHIRLSASDIRALGLSGSQDRMVPDIKTSEDRSILERTVVVPTEGGFLDGQDLKAVLPKKAVPSLRASESIGDELITAAR